MAKNKEPYITFAPSHSVTMALKALAAGNAHEEQQKMALDWIIRSLCGAYDLSYRPNDRDTVFAEGKRFVGLRIIEEININLNKGGTP